MSVGPVNETGLLSKLLFFFFLFFFFSFFFFLLFFLSFFSSFFLFSFFFFSFLLFNQTRSSGTGEAGPEKRLVLQKGLGIVTWARVQELCESRGGRPGLSVLSNLLVSVDVELY